MVTIINVSDRKSIAKKDRLIVKLIENSTLINSRRPSMSTDASSAAIHIYNFRKGLGGAFQR